MTNNPDIDMLTKLYTIEAKLKYGELPTYLRDGFLGYGWRDLNGNAIYLSDNTPDVDDDFISCQFVSIKGRLTKKCVFIKTYDLAVWLKDTLQKRMVKNYPSITILVRQVNRHDLSYRKKKALGEAGDNDEKIKTLMNG